MPTRSAAAAALRKESSSETPVMPASDSSLPVPMDSNAFALCLMEALQSPDVVSSFSLALKPTLDAIVDRIDAKMNARLKELQEELKEKDDTILKLSERVEELEGRIDDQEQYSRRTSVRLSGIPEDEKEDVQHKVMSIFLSSTSETEFDSESQSVSEFVPQINRVHRVGPKNEQGPRPIICQFLTYSDKRKCMSSKKALRKRFPNLSINEDLTRARAALSFTARQKKREGLIDKTWSADGKIVVKDLHGKIHYITRKSQFIW